MRSNLGRFHRPMSRGLVNNMLMMNNLGDGSTLSLDFTTGVLDPRLTFTRSTTATYINSSGYVTTMGAAPTNDPTKARFDYSPTNIGEPRGLLVEGAATNLTKFSETFTNAYWNTTANNVTAADSVATSPTGVALTASTLTEIAGTGSHHVHQLVGEFTPAASTAYTMSCFVKQPTSNAIRYVQLTFWSAGFGLTAYMNYDLQTGTVGTGGAGITASSITQYPNGWYRITARATSVAVPGVSGFQLGFSTTSGAVRTESYTASAPLKSIQLFGAQVEIGSGASSYISTGASQVTRNADACYLTNFAGWSAGGNFNTAEGTLFVDQAVTFVGTANYPAGGFCTSNTVGSRFGWQYRQGDAPQTYRGLVNAGYIYELPSGAGWSIPAGTTRFRHAMSCGGGTSAFLRQSFKSSASSGSPTQNTYSDVSTLNISGVAAFTLTQSAFASSVRIARVKYYPRAFTLTELDQLTN